MRDNKGFVCHVHHEMVSYEIHHVWPQEYHGPNTKANKIKICPNAHSDIHHLLDRMLAEKPVNLHEYGNSVKHYAFAGYKQVMEYIANELLPPDHYANCSRAALAGDVAALEHLHLFRSDPESWPRDENGEPIWIPLGAPE